MNPAKNGHKSPGIIGKIFTFPLVRIIFGIILINVSSFILRNTAQFVLSSLSIDSQVATSLVTFCVRMLTVYFAYILFIRIFEKREAQEISIDFSSAKELSFGGLLGLITISVVMTLMWVAGSFSITGVNGSATLLQSFLYHSFFAFLQDVVYFAVIFRIIEKSLGSWIAIVIVSIIFGFKHLLFPGYTLWSVIAQTFEAGILFSALFILTRRIWLIFGFHLVWNFIQYGLILGFEPEGLTALFLSDFSGSSLITGMPVGPEASLLTLCIGTALGLYFLVKAYRKGNFILPYWKSTPDIPASHGPQDYPTSDSCSLNIEDP
jgi:membrane protease YdiL (CAAX protease family)